MEITNEIKAKMFAQYLGYPFHWKYPEHATHDKVIQPLKAEWLDNYSGCGKLILKPISSITDEDAIEVAKILFGKNYSIGDVSRRNDYEVSVKVLIPDTTTNQNVRIGFSGGLSNCNGYGLQNMLQAYQYLQSKGYDLPQLLLDGKTLFESELAIYEN